MPTAKTIIAVAVVVLSVCGCDVASASAEESTKGWHINGVFLKEGATAALASPGALESPAVFNSPGLSLKIVCPTYNTSKAELLGNTDEAVIASGKYEGCSEISPSFCRLASSTITTTALESALFLLHPESTELPHYLRLTFPRTSKTIATITFDGEFCPFDGEKSLTGMLREGAPSIEDEATTHLIEGDGTSENNSLELAGQKIYLEGARELLKLSSGSKWSFR